MKPSIIVALDFNNLQSAVSLARTLNPEICLLKVGKELFTSAGPRCIESLRLMGFEVFLDLKFHDIPSTVYKSIKVTLNLDLFMLSVHLSGGREMISAARDALNGSRTLLMGVTILTSLKEPDFKELGYLGSMEDQVLHLSKIGSECGVDGIICHLDYVDKIRNSLRDKLLFLIPGVGGEINTKDDQRRRVSIDEVKRVGVDYFVVGRSVTLSDDPCCVVENIWIELFGNMR